MNSLRTFSRALLAGLAALGVLLVLAQRTRSCPPGLPQVYIWATDPNASEVGPDTGKFRIYRSGGDSSVPLVVYFVQPPGGTAQNGTDYQTLPEYVTIPANTTYADVTVSPILDADCAEGNETVVLTLATNANYWLGWPTNATVTIADVPPNADSDADGMPDCWELQHFGNLAQTAAGDYDADGVTNLDEYNAGTDPNTLWFETQIANLYVNARLVQGTCVVHAGVPHEMAVLVDSTNLMSATWSNYTPNFTALLPDADGLHTVLVALRGRTTQFPPVTDETDITLDRVPPVLVITNPVAGTVSKPFLQVLGYANEPLAQMHFDLTNAAGCLNNGLVVVLDQEFDTNAFDFTTTFFQAFDVELTNGLNQIVLTMSDRAGNVATTNLLVTLDYAAATNPPLMELLWPTSGAHLGGTNFYIRGRISDETAQLTAVWVDESGATNEVEGIVERNGIFWVENVPLHAGTNTVALIAQEAAGNWISTNLTVLRSDIDLIIDSAPEGEALYNTYGTVSGRVSDPNCSVTVNGVQATVDASGNWTAENVPIHGKGTATFDAVATVGGNGAATTFSLQKERPPTIIVSQHISGKTTFIVRLGLSWSRYSRDKGYGAGLEPAEEGQWIFWKAGAAVDQWQDNLIWRQCIYTWTTAYRRTYCRDSFGSESESDQIWYDQFGEITGVPDKDVRVEGWGGTTPPVFVEHFFAKGVRYEWPWGGGFMLTAVGGGTRLKLYTGGKGRIGRQNLLCINARAETYGKPPKANPGMPWLDTPASPIPPQQIQILGKALGSDGKPWLVLPDNFNTDLNLTAPGRHYGAWASVEKYHPFIRANGVNLEETTPEFCVGQKVTFNLDWSYLYPYSGIPPGLQSNYCDWVASAKCVNTNWTSRPPTGYGNCEPFPTEYGNSHDLWQCESPFAWWTSGGKKHVKVTTHIYFTNEQAVKLNRRGAFHVFRPVVRFPHTVLRPMVPMLTNGWLQLGDGINFGNAEFDALITSKAPFTGKANWTQLIRRDNSNPLCFGPGPCYLGSTGGSEILDSSEFYNDEHSDILPRGSDPNPRGWVSFWDNPGVLCIFNFTLHDQFRTYLRFKPDGDGNIWITLGVVQWGWGGTKVGSTITNPTTDGPAFEDTDTFPSWDVRIYEILP